MYPEYIELQCNRRSGTLYKEMIKLQQENNQLQSNWNSLREWLEKQNKFYEVSTMGYSYGVICNVLDKMNELEGGDNENN